MKEVKAWLVQEFLGYGNKGRVDGREWNKCPCGARMELKVDATGTQYLSHPKGISADKAHKRGMAHHSVYGTIQGEVVNKVVDHAKLLQLRVNDLIQHEKIQHDIINGLKADLVYMSAREIHDKYHNPMQCWFVCDYGDDRSYD